MADLNWAFPPDAPDEIEHDALRVLLLRCGLFLGELPASLTGHALKQVRVKSDETGWEYSAAGLTGLTRVCRSITGDTTLSASHADVVQAGAGSLEVGFCLVKHSTPSSSVTITVPSTATVGTIWTIVQSLDQTGNVLITPQSGATLQGGTGSITMDGPGSIVSLLVTENIGGSAAKVIVAGGSSLGQILSGLTVQGETQGSYRALGSAITDNVTLSSDDVGKEREITASSTKTITVPSGFRGEVYLWNSSAASHTVALTGVGNRTLAAGKLGIVHGTGSRLGLRVQDFAAS